MLEMEVDTRIGGEKPTEKRRERKARRTGQILPRGECKWLVRIFLGGDASSVKHYHRERVKEPSRLRLEARSRSLQICEEEGG